MADDTHAHSLDLPLLSWGMTALLSAQFLSALADNAVLIAAIAVLKAQTRAGDVPFLQAAFVIPFILLAPWVGRLADAYPKGRVMLVSNAVKLLGAGLMASGLLLVPAYGLIGMGAAAYSPAKYGILSQMFRRERLVKANGLLEASTIVAILLGVVLGGLLADKSVSMAFTAVLGCYGLAALFNLGIPALPPEKVGKRVGVLAQARHFAGTLGRLTADRDARFSLLGTSVFWGSGSTLRLMLFAWVPVVLGLSDNQTPANLMGALSVGIVIGAGAAGAWVTLQNVNRALLGGLLLGPLVMALAVVNNLGTAYALMVAIGAGGGFFVVPLNALLQERGHRSVGAGQALAIQNFAENLAMLIFVGFYSAAEKAGVPVTLSATAFGLLILAVLLPLAWGRWRTGKGA
jgi:LPLT family lysophospholipid transporter-like MFS transporter